MGLMRAARKARFASLNKTAKKKNVKAMRTTSIPKAKKAVKSYQKAEAKVAAYKPKITPKPKKKKPVRPAWAGYK